MKNPFKISPSKTPLFSTALINHRFNSKPYYLNSLLNFQLPITSEMQEIPLEVFREILSRLPAELLLRLRCVCKSWRDAIDDPITIKLHLDRLIQGSSNGIGQVILRGDLDCQLYSVPLESLSSARNFVRPRLLTRNPLDFCKVNKLAVGSCNGIMLISHSKRYNFLWNPLTREFHMLPALKVMLKKSSGLYVAVSGLGYDSGDDDYKVVKIAQVFDPRDKDLKSETLLYSLKSDSWKRIKDFPHRISQLVGGVFVNGALHWISSTLPLKSMPDLIIGLDLVREDYSLLPLPSALCVSEMPSAVNMFFAAVDNPYIAMVLGVLDGCLILSCYYHGERLDVWLMKDYGVQSSWVKLFSIANVDNIGAVETLKPITYSKCKGKVLLQHDGKEFLWFNLETRSFRKVRIQAGPTTFSSQFCLESLVRVNVGNGYGGSSNGDD